MGRLERLARQETMHSNDSFFSLPPLFHLFFASLSRDVRIDRLHLHNIIAYLFRRLLLKRSPVSLITLMSLHEYTHEQIHVCACIYINIPMYLHRCLVINKQVARFALRRRESEIGIARTQNERFVTLLPPFSFFVRVRLSKRLLRLLYTCGIPFF